MKIQFNKWLGCGLVIIMTLGFGVSIHHANADQITARNYRNLTIQPVSRNRKPSKESIAQITTIPDQGYTNYVTGQNALFSLPGTVNNARVVYTRRAMRNFANRRIRFMTYQRAVTNHGLVYYKIVSQRHSVRGWMYQNAIRSMLNRRQQAADFTFGSQITHAEMVADQSKHESLVYHSEVNLKSAQDLMNQAKASVRSLRGTPDYQSAKASLQAGQRYLRRLATVKPSVQTMTGLVAIRSEYKRADKAVSAAQEASLNHQPKVADHEIKKANRSLRHVSRTLNQIHNRKDRRIAMALFNHALKYVNSNYSFDPARELNGRNLNSRKVSNDHVVTLINNYETAAQNSIMDLYPNLNNFDVALTDAYQAQNDLNQANDLVSGLQGAHVRKTELNDIKLNQHNINDLWNV